MKIIKYLEAIFDAIMDALFFIAGVLLILIMLSVTMDVIMRYFLNRPQFWVGELSEYALLYITFTGTAWVLKKDAHVKIDILSTLLSPKKINILGLFASIICIFVCIVLIYYGVKVTWDHFARRVFLPTLMQFPKGPLLAIIPVGAFLLLIQFMRRISQLLREFKIR